MRAYVINLTRSLDRREHITAELTKTGIDYEIVPAVDGRELDVNDATLMDAALVARCSFPGGTIACCLSHLEVYKKILADGPAAALVLEDDVTLPDDLTALTDAVASHLTGAEVALLNFGGRVVSSNGERGDPPEILRMSPAGVTDLPSSRRLALPIDVRQLVNGGGYIITREACQRMAERLLPIKTTADAWGFFYQQGMLDRVRCVLPQPVAKSPKFESTIGIYSLGSGVKARVLAPLVRHKIPLLHQAVQYRRQRILRDWDRSEVFDVPFVLRPSRLG